MTFVKRIEELLAQKYFTLIPATISALGALVNTTRLTDQHFDIVQAGTRWMNGSILYVQSYSTHSPQTLYFGYLYGKLLTNGFMQFIFELLVWLATVLLVYGVAKKIMRKSILLRSSLLLTFSAMTFAPGIWQHGLSDHKLGVLFLALSTYSYLLWKESSTTVWLLGTTTKNWRFILLSGISLSLAMYTSPIYLFISLPLLIDFVQMKSLDLSQKLRWSLFLVVPFLLEAWVWISYLSSHRLLSNFYYAQTIGLKQSVHAVGDLSLSLPALLLLLPLAVTLLVKAYSKEFRLNRALWVWAACALVACAIWPVWALYSCIVFIPILLFIQNKRTVLALRPWLIATLALLAVILCLPLRLLASSQSQLETARAQLAIAYIEQRMVDSDYVTYYGRGAGFYELSGFSNPSRYSDLVVTAYDSAQTEIESSFRGDVEAFTPLFAVIATDSNLKAPGNQRLDQYFAKHYEKVADLDGYSILKRK